MKFIPSKNTVFCWLYEINFQSLAYKQQDQRQERLMKYHKNEHSWKYFCTSVDFVWQWQQNYVPSSPPGNGNSSTVDIYTCLLCSPVLDQGALFGGGVCSASGPRGYGLQHHHLGLVKETPAIVDPDVEPPFLDGNHPWCTLWSWLFLTIIRRALAL